MKHIPATLLPALALLTLGGCATTNGLTTTEPDGIYYSSKDRTSAVATAAAADASSDYSAATEDPDAVANPDYQENSRRSRGTASDEYYEDDFDYSYYARRRRYNGLGMGYGLSYVDPFWYRPTFVYNDPFFYSPFAYSAWNDPFWGPGWYAGPAVSINVGWGFGGWGPWGGYRPYGFGGYNRGFWDGYYSGLYGGGGWYGGGWGWRNGFNNYGYWDGYRGGNRSVSYRVAPRRDRSVEVVGSNQNNGGGRLRVDEATGGRAANPAPSRYRSRVEEGPVQGGRAAQDQQLSTSKDGSQPGRGRLYRVQDAAPNVVSGAEQTGGVRPVPQPGNETLTQPDEQINRYNSRRSRYEEASQTKQPATSPEPDQPQQYQRARRDRYADYNTPSQPAEQAPQPTRRERSYDAAPTRSYEPPTRSYERSSNGNSGGSNYGGGRSGGSSGGGNSGGGRGRVQ
ncbi:hypothetical protein [Hymenobacter coalescens]